MALSAKLADEMWLHTLERANEDFKLSVLRGQQILAAGEPDWIIDALHQVPAPRGNSLADAVAYTALCGVLEQERLYLCLRPSRTWACANADIEGNQAALESAGVVGTFTNTAHGYDGFVTPTELLLMSRLYITDKVTPRPVPIAFTDSGRYPLEVGSCPMSKTVAILMTEGRLARLPYAIHTKDATPVVYFFRMLGKTISPGL